LGDLHRLRCRQLIAIRRRDVADGAWAGLLLA